MTLDDGAKFIAIEAVCERYALTRAQVLRLVERGAFPPALRVGGMRSRLIRFRAADVDAWEGDSWQRAGDEAARVDAIRASIRQPPEVRASRRPVRRWPR